MPWERRRKMAEPNIAKNQLNNVLPYQDELPVNLLAAIFKDKNQSYKLFWFQAILELVCKRKTTLTFDELFNTMIADAWYMVMEYHLNLGPADSLETMINQVKLSSGLTSNAKKDAVIEFISSSDDKNVKEAKRKLSLNVPFRLQAPFLGKLQENEWKNYNYIEQLAKSNKRVLYYYEMTSDKKKQIIVNEVWIKYLQKNEAIIRGWIQNEMIQYLQRRNPNVPGIPFKLRPPEKRDLKKPIEFWNTIILNYNIKDVYTGKIINQENIDEYGKIDIDHFIPWSYVACDEIWNLTPTFSSINRSKSNLLPSQDKDLSNLSTQHFQAIQIAKSNKEIMKLFEKCKEKHLNSDEADRRLYINENKEDEFRIEMNSLILPIHMSAKNLGFVEWEKRMR